MANFKVSVTQYVHGVFGSERREYVVKASNKASAEAVVTIHLAPGKPCVDCYMHGKQTTSAYARQLRKRGYKSIKA